MSFSDLTATVKSAVTVSESTAIRKIKEAVTLGIIKKTFAGLYEYKR
jgi:DNA-binding Lrp family transcriptional regulator